MKFKTNKWKKLLLSTLAAGIGMWVVGGLWHNLVLPTFNNDIQAHHEGLGVTLIAYLLLAFLFVSDFHLSRDIRNLFVNGDSNSERTDIMSSNEMTLS